MVCTVIGKRSYSFADKQTGELVERVELHVTYPDDRIDGLACEVVSLRPETAEGVNVGDGIRMDRNKYGRVIALERVMPDLIV